MHDARDQPVSGGDQHIIFAVTHPVMPFGRHRQFGLLPIVDKVIAAIRFGQMLAELVDMRLGIALVAAGGFALGCLC